MTKLFSLFLALVSALFAFITPAKTEEKEYPLTALVVNLDEENNIVECEDYAGNIWKFYGIEDWYNGDLVSMIMNDKGTANITDDEIVMVRYGGWIGHYGAA